MADTLNWLPYLKTPDFTQGIQDYQRGQAQLGLQQRLLQTQNQNWQDTQNYRSQLPQVVSATTPQAQQAVVSQFAQSGNAGGITDARALWTAQQAQQKLLNQYRVEQVARTASAINAMPEGPQKEQAWQQALTWAKGQGFDTTPYEGLPADAGSRLALGAAIPALNQYQAMNKGFAGTRNGVVFNQSTGATVTSPSQGSTVQDGSGNYYRLDPNTMQAVPYTTQGGQNAPGGAQGGSGPPVGAQANIAAVMAREGGYKAQDGNGQPVNFGINQGANPDINVKNLNAGQAAQIYKSRYWDAIGGDNLPPAIQAQAFDAAVNMGVPIAQRLLQQSGGDPQKFAQLRAQAYTQIAQNNPSLAPNLPGWLQRTQDAAHGAQPQQGVPFQGMSKGSGALQQKIALARSMGASDDQIKAMVLGNAQNNGTPQPFGDATKTGDAYLASLTPAQAGQLKALDEGRMAFPTGMAIKTPYWQSMLASESQYDPNFDAVNYNSRAKTRADFVAGKSAQQLRNLNQGISHLGLLNSQISGTAGNSIPLIGNTVNAVENAYNEQSGDPGITNYKNTQGNLASELTAIFRGTGGAEADINRYLAALSPNMSTAQKQGAVKNIVSMLNARIGEIGKQYNDGMGRTIDPLSLLNPQSQAIMRSLGGGESQPVAGNFTPSPLASSPTQYKMTATNPKTGQRMGSNDGNNWTPIQ